MRDVQQPENSGKGQSAPLPQPVPASFAAHFVGACLCDEIDPADRPCLSCEAQDVIHENADDFAARTAAAEMARTFKVNP